MQKIGRNDLCTCGSGKKYKNCCGKNSVVSIDSLIETDLQELQLNLLDYSLKNYQDEMEDYLEDCYDDVYIPDEAYEMFHFFSLTWFITSVELEEGSILEDFVDRISSKISRQRVKDILETWKTAKPSVYNIQHQDNHNFLTLEDIFTNVLHKVRVTEEDHIVETGGLVLGTILPAGSTSIFFTTFLDLPAPESEELKAEIYNLYEDSEAENPAEFMSSSFIEVLDLFMFGNSNLSLAVDDIEWTSPKQKEVVEIFQEYMENFGHEETIVYLGIFLWKVYCERKNPSIKNPNVFGAGLIYLVDKILPFGGFITQKDLAVEFEVSSGSISSRYKDLENVLSDEIENLQDTINEADFDFDDIFEDEDEDFFDEDIFDEDDEDDDADDDDIFDMDDFKKDK